jgi:hypothetical protein
VLTHPRHGPHPLCHPSQYGHLPNWLASRSNFHCYFLKQLEERAGDLASASTAYQPVAPAALAPLQAWARDTIPNWWRVSDSTPWAYEAHTVLAVLAKWCLSGSAADLRARDHEEVVTDRTLRLEALHRAGKYPHHVGLSPDVQAQVLAARLAPQRTQQQPRAQAQAPPQSNKRSWSARAASPQPSRPKGPWCAHHGYVGHPTDRCKNPWTAFALRYMASPEWKVDAEREGWTGPPPTPPSSAPGEQH